jgi:hypothetical protein
MEKRVCKAPSQPIAGQSFRGLSSQVVGGQDREDPGSKPSQAKNQNFARLFSTEKAGCGGSQLSS